MSEPCSSFLRVTIPPERLQEFLAAAPRPAHLTGHWTRWWDSLRMHSARPLEEAALRPYPDATNQAVVDNWLAATHAAAATEYDPTTQRWTFAILLATENYIDLLPLLVFAHQLAEYATPEAHDGLLVYPYLWGDNDIMAYLSFTEKGARLSDSAHNLDHVPAPFRQQADDWLQAHLQSLSDLD